MLDVQRSDSLRERKSGIPSSSTHLPPIMSEVCVSTWKPTERNVSFNQDVHVKRIGRAIPRISGGLAGDGEGRLIPTPIHKESIAHRTKEDLAEEAALVLHQASNLHCVTQGYRQLPGRFSTLPLRQIKKRPEVPLNVRRKSEEIGGRSNLDVIGTPKTKKKFLDGSTSDVVTKGLKSSLAKFFSPKLERKRNPVKRSVSDIGVSTRFQRKTITSNNELAHLNANRAKKQLSPIIEASPQVDQQPFQFNNIGNTITRNSNNSNDNDSISINDDTGGDEKYNKKDESSHRPQSYKRYRHEFDVANELTGTIGSRKIMTGETSNSFRIEEGINEHRIPIKVEHYRQEEEVGKACNLRTEGAEKPKKISKSHSPTTKATIVLTNDEVDNTYDISMMNTDKYGFQQNNEELTIHKMINRLSNDRSPPPQLSRTMISPGPGLGHNNNKPFSYTRLNDELCTLSPLQNPNTAYILAQSDEKKAYKTDSNSGKGLGLERKDSVREINPTETVFQPTDYLHNKELRQNNDINHFKSSVDEDPNIEAVNSFDGGNDSVPANLQNEKCYEVSIDNNGRTREMPSKYESCIHTDQKVEERINHSDLRSTDSTNQCQEQNQTGVSHKTSELSARRDLLESRIKSRLFADEIFVANNNIGVPIMKPEQQIIDKPIVPSPVIPKHNTASQKRYMDTYITQTRMNSKGDKYIFEKEIHEKNGKIYECEKKIMNKVPTDGGIKTKANNGYTVETKINKYGDKYIVQTRTHKGFATDTEHPFGDENFTVSTDGKLELSPNADIRPHTKSGFYFPQEVKETTSMIRTPSPNIGCCEHVESRQKDDILNTPTMLKEYINKREYSKSDDMLDSKLRINIDLNVQSSEANNKLNFFHRTMSKSSQLLNEAIENVKGGDSRRETVTRSYENLNSGHANYVNTTGTLNKVPFLKRAITVDREDNKFLLGDKSLYILQERRNNDYDFDVSQSTRGQLGFKHSKEVCKTYKHISSKCHATEEGYDNPPPRVDTDCAAGYNSIQYDSDTTAKDSVHGDVSYEQSFRTSRKHCNVQPIGNLKNSSRTRRNPPDYPDNSDIRDTLQKHATLSRNGSIDKCVGNFIKPSKIKNEISRAGNTITPAEQCYRDIELHDFDKKDRIENSSIEHEYRRVPQDINSHKYIESEDEGSEVRQFAKYNRKHTDRKMNLMSSEKRKHRNCLDDAIKLGTTIPKPMNTTDKKIEKKVTKTGSTMSKVKQLFGKKVKKMKEDKSKTDCKSVTSGAFTDDEVTMRYQEYRGPQLRSVKSAKDLNNDTNQEDYSQRKRLSTPTGSPRLARLSRSTGTLMKQEELFCESCNTLTRKNQCQEDDTRGWFKSIPRNNKDSAKLLAKKPKIPDNEILMIGPESDDASLPPEQIFMHKNLRFFGDTDQESVSSYQEQRHKQTDEHAQLQRDATCLTHHNLHMITNSRKPPRLTESALSSGESTTGDSSQQSQNSQRSQISVVYLHAPTVGEIPGPSERRKAASREELNRPLQSHTRTVSRSVSVLAPWKPRYYKDSFEINYDQQQHQQDTASMRRKQYGRETLTRREEEARCSKDNLAKTGTINRNTFKLKDKRKVDRAVSTELLASMSRNTPTKMEVNRTTSVPRDTSKNAGWFKLKNKKYRI